MHYQEIALLREMVDKASKMRGKSSDKLLILMDGLSKFPVSKFEKVKKMEIDWVKMDSETFCPNFNIEFFE